MDRRNRTGGRDGWEQEHCRRAILAHCASVPLVWTDPVVGGMLSVVATRCYQQDQFRQEAR